MKLRVLGCSGGIGGSLYTTSMLLDRDILIDAGTGVTRLSLEEMCLIDHVFVTHSHLDHIASIPFIVDSVGHLRQKPLVVHSTAETIEILRNHIFNWQIWPDFNTIPSGKSPYMRYQSFVLGETVELNGRKITSLPAVHTVPAVGFHLQGNDGSLVFSGDTTTNDALWQKISEMDDLRYLIVETAFPDKDMDLAIRAKHMCPALLRQDLSKYKKNAPIYITHLKPGEAENIMSEVREISADIMPLLIDQIFEF